MDNKISALVNCGACPDLHKHDNLAGVILVTRDETGQHCPSYINAEVLAVIVRWPDGKMEISSPHATTPKERLWITRGLAHLAGHRER